MKAFRKRCTAILFLLALASPLMAQETEKNQILDRVVHDFGTLRPGQPETTVFTVTNTGETPLIILDVKMSCRCVKVQWPRTHVLPGKSAELTVTYKDRSPGAFYKTIDLITSIPQQTTQIKLKGNIE